jgi:hypothetical protein
MVGETPDVATSLRRLSAREREIAGLVAVAQEPRYRRAVRHQREHRQASPAKHLWKTGAHDRLELAALALREVQQAA